MVTSLKQASSFNISILTLLLTSTTVPSDIVTLLISIFSVPPLDGATKSTSYLLLVLKKELDENSLLQYGTWAYLADTHNTNKSCAYLFWTSVDTNSVGEGVRIPVIVSKDGGGFYVSDSITATRTKKKEGSYIAISDHILNYNGFKQFTTGVNYGSLEQAYTAYSKYVHSNYPEFISTLPK